MAALFLGTTMYQQQRPHHGRFIANGSLIFRNHNIPATEATPWKVYPPMAALYLGTTMYQQQRPHHDKPGDQL